MSPLLVNPSEIKTFHELLQFHMNFGTRPENKAGEIGTIWTPDNLSKAAHVNIKTVRNWESGVNRPNSEEFNALEHALFGKNKDLLSWQVQFRELWRIAGKQGRPPRRRPGSPLVSAGFQKLFSSGANSRSSTTSPATLAPFVDIIRLPTTPNVRLAGREDDLDFLDRASHADSHVRILTVVGWGGCGKTALVNAWLERSQAKGYNGASAVLGWSFYNQSTKERLTSSKPFFAWAFAVLGFAERPTSATACGEILARHLHGNRIFLILDGLETLQHGPGLRQGELRDLGMHTMLRRLAAEAPRSSGSLILLTSRLAIVDIASSERSGHVAIFRRLTALSPKAGAELLRDNLVYGTEPRADGQLEDASREFGGHPLALSLLAKFLVQRFGGDVRCRDRVKALVSVDTALEDERLHGHARRVMRSIHDEWLRGDPVLQAVMEMIGLFDRPVAQDCIDVLRRWDGIRGLTDVLARLSHDAWSLAISQLRNADLLLPAVAGGDDALDAHPLVREWFGELLRDRHPSAWRAAHARLYEHLRETQEGEQPSRWDLEPLYRAVIHGCRAGLYRSALIDTYMDRICRDSPHAGISNYAAQIHGAVSDNLAVLSEFFIDRYETIHPSLDERLQHRVLTDVAFCLREMGRLSEAIRLQSRALQISLVGEEWDEACAAIYMLIEMHVSKGDLPVALSKIGDCIVYSKKAKRKFWLDAALAFKVYINDLISTHTTAGTSGNALVELSLIHATASRSVVYDSYVSTLRTLHICEHYLRLGWYDRARTLALQQGRIADRHSWRLPAAWAKLYACRSNLGDLLTRINDRNSPAPGPDKSPATRGISRELEVLTLQYDETLDAFADTGVGFGRTRGFLARARFRVALGRWDAAVSDINEAEEIAKTGQMDLFAAEIALLRCRLLIASSLQFQPLLVTNDDAVDPPQGTPRNVNDYLLEAAGLIEKHSYFSLNSEWQELAEIINDNRKIYTYSVRI